MPRSKSSDDAESITASFSLESPSMSLSAAAVTAAVAFSTAAAVRRPWPPPLAAFASADLGFSTPSVHGYRARPPESETASPYGPSAGALNAESPKSKIT